MEIKFFEFVAIIGLSGLGLFLYFLEMPFILYSDCLCKCLFAWIETEQFNFCNKKQKEGFLFYKCFFFSGSTRVNLSDPWLDHLTRSMTGSGFKTIPTTTWSDIYTYKTCISLVYRFKTRMIFNRLFAWLLLRLKQPQQNKYLVKL